MMGKEGAKSFGWFVVLVGLTVFGLNSVTAVDLNQANFCDQSIASDYHHVTTASQILCDGASFFANGATFTQNHTFLDCLGKEIASDNGAGYGIRLSGVNQNVTIQNCRITNYQASGIELAGSNHTIIRDSNISQGSMTHLRLTGASWNNSLLNVSFDTDSVSANSNYTRAWYLSVVVRNCSG